MKNIHKIFLVSVASAWVTGVPALPVAQLDFDAAGVGWDAATQTVVTNDPQFTLLAYGNTPSGTGKALDLALDWRLSVSITPESVTGKDFGSFTLDGVTYDKSDFQYGVPPLETFLTFQSGDLSRHGVYPTLFMELDVAWLTSQTRAGVDVQTTQGSSPAANPGADLYWLGWDFNVAGLLPGFNLHFDLYGVSCSSASTINCTVRQFAPFSHDAETSVPEPATAALLGAGLLLLGVTARSTRAAGRP